VLFGFSITTLGAVKVEAETFYIRSVTVQNVIMGFVAAVILGLLIRFVWEHKPQYVVATVIWGLVTLWFFNGPLWGFSAVTVSPEGLKVHYGFLCVFRNTTLPLDTHWKIRNYMGGIRRLKKLSFFQLGNRESLKVRGQDKLEVLKALGVAIDRINGRSMGSVHERPVNM
jgi:hypothetical protein